MRAVLAAVTAGGLAVGGASAAPMEGPGAPKGLWKDATAETIGATADWSNKVELADLNGDGMVDLLFANGGNYREPGEPTTSTIFLNQGPGKPFKDATDAIFGDEPMLCRVIKAADVNGDGAIDIFFGGVYHHNSRLLLGDGKGGFKDVSATNLPEHSLSLGDAEFGDVDMDGDLDLALADWGQENPMRNEGGLIQLWLNDGEGKFTEAAAGTIPDKKIKMSWDIELTDVDNDYDLDLWISSKLSEGGSLFVNDGAGKFTDVTDGKLPQLTNNYEFEPIDLNGDGYVDSFTINDGGAIPGKRGMRKESVFFSDGKGGFEVVTDTAFPESENLGWDDNRIIAFDYDSDGDADILIGSLSGPDRLAINDGKGNFKVALEVVDGPETRGTLGVQAADLNGDGRLDLVMSQGEVKGHEAEMVFLGTDALPKDTAAPVIAMIGVTEDGCVRARVNDNSSPTRLFHFQSVEATVGGKTMPMTWYGEHLWTACGVQAKGKVKIAAVDAAGNKANVSAKVK